MIIFVWKLPIFTCFLRISAKPTLVYGIAESERLFREFWAKTHPCGQHIPISSTCYVHPPPPWDVTGTKVTKYCDFTCADTEPQSFTKIMRLHPLPPQSMLVGLAMGSFDVNFQGKHCLQSQHWLRGEGIWHWQEKQWFSCSRDMGALKLRDCTCRSQYILWRIAETDVVKWRWSWDWLKNLHLTTT